MEKTESNSLCSCMEGYQCVPCQCVALGIMKVGETLEEFHTRTLQERKEQQRKWEAEDAEEERRKRTPHLRLVWSNPDL